MKKLLFDLFPIIVFFIAYKIGDANAEATRALRPTACTRSR